MHFCRLICVHDHSIIQKRFAALKTPLSVLASSTFKFCTFNKTAIFSLFFFPSPRGFYFRHRRELILFFGRDPRKVTLFGCNIHIPGKSPLLVLVFLPVQENTKTCFAKCPRGSPFPQNSWAVRQRAARGVSWPCPALTSFHCYFLNIYSFLPISWRCDILLPISSVTCLAGLKLDF